MEQFNWAQGKIEAVTGLTKEQREDKACQRRLSQMAKKREKQRAKEVKQLIKENSK